MAQEDSGDFNAFLRKVQQETKEDVENYFLSKRDREAIESSDQSQEDHSKKLLKALEEANVFEAWKLIAERKFTETLENLNSVCKAIAEEEKEKNREDGLKCLCKWNCKKLCKGSIHWSFAFHDETTMQSEKERESIKILSNPLYISLEWLWRNNSKFQCEEGVGHKGVIEAALDDAYLLEKIASNEHHYSRDEYKERAMEYEKFAVDIVEQVNSSDIKQLHEIMDIEGNGSLLNKKPDNFIQSVSLLKMAADKQRKKVN